MATKKKKSGSKPIEKLLSGDDPLEWLWQKDSQTIRDCLDQRPLYEDLCSEIAYILRKELNKKGVEIASVTCRAKTLKSFAGKLIRKTYDAPLKDIEDFAGARVVCLYQTDLIKIEEIIESEFNVIEKVDKSADQESDQFGYGAIHYIVKLSTNHSGARYNELKNLVCEIQARTVVQDAWAIIDHHLAYKHKGAFPTVILRKLSRLAAVFEDADDRFVQIREEKEQYIRSIEQAQPSSKAFLNREINVNTLEAFMASKLPAAPQSDKSFTTSHFILNRTEKAREALARELKAGKTTRTIHGLFALMLDKQEALDLVSEDNQEKFKKVQYLVEPR